VRAGTGREGVGSHPMIRNKDLALR